MKNMLYLTALLLFFNSCETHHSKELTEQWKQEIRESEANFAAMLQEKGMHDAFVAYAAEDAVVMRNNTLIVGKTAIDTYFKNAKANTLTWSPDFIEVSSSGDLGYTYGTYQYTFKDSLDIEQLDTGIFHTVWKRQDDGSWKFVWD